MVKPVKLQIKERMTEKEQAIEKFTDILNVFHDKGSTVEDFKNKFSAWSKAFISENKLNESLKSQAIVHLKLSRISRVLIAAIVSVCILETYTKFQKSFAYLGLTLYLSVIAMNLVSNIIIAYRNSQNEYISEVNQYFESVYAMFQLFEKRLDVLRRRCNWNVKSDSVPSEIEPEYTNQDTVYGRLYSSAFHLYNIYGIVVGFIICLLCFYLEFEIFASLEVFTICLLFAIAIAKDIKFHKLHGRLQKSTKFMRNETVDFLTWFENDCEICKILQQHQVSNTVTNLFLMRTLSICRKPRYLNCAISITACDVFAGLNVSRNDFKNALIFLAYGKYFVLDKLTVKSINTQVVKQPRKEKKAKEKYQLSCSHALSRNLDHSREIPKCTEINRCRAADDNTKEIYSENKSNSYFANEDTETDSKHINETGTSTPPKYIGKESKISFSNNKSDEALNPETKGRSFDENLPLRYELRKIEPEEKAVSACETDFSDLDEMCSGICSCKLLTEYKGGKPYNRDLVCRPCLDNINRYEVLSPIYTKELCQNKVEPGDGSEKSYSYVEEISKKSTRSGTFDAEDIAEKFFNGFLLCKRCFDMVNRNSTRYAMSENELCQRKEEPGGSVTKHSTKVSKEYSNTDDLFVSEYKDTDLKTNVHKTNESAANNFNKSVVISHDEHSCDSTSSSSTAETDNFNELVASDFNEINDSNLHEQRTNKIKFKDESEAINKDLSLNINGNKPVKVNVKCVMTVDACPSGHASDHTSDETKNYIHENEMLERQFNEGISSDKQERITHFNSIDKINKSFLSDHSHHFKGVCINLTENSETHSNSDRPFESSFSGNSESDSNKQNKNSFAGEYNETQIPSDEINYERLMNNLVYDTENYPSGSNSFENEISDSGFFEPGGNEIKCDIEYRIIEEDKIEDKHSYAPAEVTDNVRVTSNTIEKTEVHANQNETSEKIFNENRKSYLHKQKLSETKLMDMDAHDITTKKFVVGNISNNPNPNTDKDILNHDVCISENGSMFLKNVFETTIDNSSYYPVDSGVIDVNQDVKSRTAISSINKSNYEDVIDSLSNEAETSLNVHETTNHITNTNESVDFNQKSEYETQLNGEFGITSKTIMELGINLTGEIDTSSNFKDICESQNGQDTQKREKSIDENINGIINGDMSNEFLPKVNVDDIRQSTLCYENISSVSGRDLTLLKPCETARTDRWGNLPDANKENFTPENAEEDRSGKIDKERKGIYERKNSKNRNNRKRSQKKRHFKSRNKETINRCTNKITDSAGAIDHLGDTIEAFPNESTDLEGKELMPNDSKNFSLLDETDKTAIGIADEISEQIKHVNVTKTFEELQNYSLQKDFYELVTDLNNHDKINTTSEIYQNSMILNQEYKNKPNDSMTGSAGAIDHLGDTMEAFANESTDLERNELMPNDSKNFSLLNGTDKTEVGISDETYEQIKHVNVTKTSEEVQNSSLRKDFNELVTDLNNHDKINTASEIHQNSLIPNQEGRDKLNDSITNADCYFDDQNVPHEENYPELNCPLSQKIDSPVSDKELEWTMIAQENFKQAIGSEQKSITMEIPYCETNNKIEIKNTDNIKSIFATPSFAIESLKNDDKCIISTNETVYNKNELTNVPKSGDIILHSTNTAALSESEKIASTENIATDSSRSKSCLTGTSSRIIKKGRRRIREKLKNEEQTNFVSLESSSGSGFIAKASTEKENRNRLIVDKEQTNCVSLESSAGSVFNANTSTEEGNRHRHIVDKEQTNCVSLVSSAGSILNAKASTEEENSNRLIADKRQIICNKEQHFNANTSTDEENKNKVIVDKEQTNCVSLESSEGIFFNAKARTEEENRNRLIVDKQYTNCVSLASSARSVLNAKISTEEENSNRLIVDKEQANCFSLESSTGSVVNAKTGTEEENGNRLIVDKEKINWNKEHTNYFSLESSAESVSNPKINTEEKNNISTVVVNIHSLNERKIQLAEQLPLESGDTESDISLSEKSSCQKLTEDSHRIRSPRNIKDEVQNRSNESATNTAEISNSQCSHITRYPGNNYDEAQNKINESATNTVGTFNSFTYKENEMTSKCTTNPENDHTELDLEKQSFATAASTIENDAKISECNEIFHTRSTLTRLWKNEKNKKFNIEYRNAVKRKIIHLEKELRTNDQSRVRKLSVVDVNENKFAFQTADGDEHFSSELEVSCRYSDGECEEIHDKRIRSWLQSVDTENSSEISQKGLNESKTPPTGSSEDCNFHFHQSTSPSDTSWDASGESGDTYSRQRSSASFSTNQESFECLEINKDKKTSLEKRINSIVDSSDSEISKTHGGIKWETMSSGGKPHKIPNSQPMISNSTSIELEQTARNSKSNEIAWENRNKISELENESELIFQKSGKFSYSADACSTKKHFDSMPSDVQLNSETFEALTVNYDAEQNNFLKTNQTDPLKYHLIYKNLELHVSDSSPSLTIRLIDENDDSDAVLTPRRRRFVNSSLSSSNSSTLELQLPSKKSSSSSGETVKENINISVGELKMLVGKSHHEEASVSSDLYKNLINKNAMENIAEFTDIKDSDILMNSGNADKVNQNKQQNKDLSVASEFHESESFADKHALTDSNTDNNDVPGGYNETVMKETGVVRTSSFENTDVRDKGNLIDSKSAHKVSEEKNKEDQSAIHEFCESERITNKNIINESFVDNNDVPDGNIENFVKETEVIAICSAENIDVRESRNLIDIENSDKVSQHKNKGDQSAMFEFEESEHFVNKHSISESVEIGDHVLGRNIETVLKETKVLPSASFDKDCDEVSDIRDNDNLIDRENNKVGQQKNKGDRVETYEFHEPENFANKHTIHKFSLDNNDVSAVNIETGVIASCSSGNISSEQYSVGNEISKTDANNITDKNINQSVINDNHVPGGNTETIVKETEVVSSCSFQKNHDNSAGQYPVGNEISDTDANNVSDTNVNPAGIGENVSVDTEMEVTTKNKFSNDFQFETNGIKLTCKPRSESDSVEVKFRKLEDKTKLTFKSGYKKLYLKMSSKT